ncbi:lysozyme [Evansella caseinilytica]|uniref:Lysozyme n=1 Tax=Evansella caseinilytica TaxID=1503961 RepID=A0A1H3UF83_9BACI|nr:lysozyme [Evansella caseinilytica]
MKMRKNTKREKRTRKLLASLGIFVVIGVLLLAYLWYQGIIVPNEAKAKQYSVMGVDVASYQGAIDWPALEQQGIQFAFIKATEGSSFVDQYFADNWGNAEMTRIRKGAYHFFSYDSEGKTQAQHFINTVPVDGQALPPVIDVEFYGDKEKNPPLREEVEKELTAMVMMLEEHYGKQVIIYATKKAYDLYIKGGYENCDIWIRDVYSKPSIPDNREWTFWQYSDRGRLDGYDGKEKFIDLNVFYGSQHEFENYGN